MSTAKLAILAPMPIEASAIRSGLRDGGIPPADARVIHVGIGRGSADRARRALGVEPGPALVAGVCGALSPGMRPGDVVLASELRTVDGHTIPCPDPAILAGALRRGGLTVHVGPVVSSRKVVTGKLRGALHAGGAIAVDMESAWIAAALEQRRVFTLRVVLDSPERELRLPWHTVTGFAAARTGLRRAAALLGDWIAALDRRAVVLAAPRASCAGVDRAIQIVERALQERGAPVYVRKQIVHNAHVVADLERRGAVFVEDLDAVPPGSTAIFSAHGVSPAVRDEAVKRNLEVIDATCPLVAKVHAEARRFAGAGFEIVLIGHEGHEEIDGTLGEAPRATRVISTPEQVKSLEIEDPDRVAYLTQTTLAIDETSDVVDALRERFPALAGPSSSDICYATQNRQDAVRALADDCEFVLVVGSRNSSNSCRLVEVAQRAGTRAMLIEDSSEIRPEQLHGVMRVGLTAGASAPESLVQGVVKALRALGEVEVGERSVAREEVHFKLPLEVRTPAEVIH